MQKNPYGFRARIGLIYIASAYAMDVEFQEMAPSGVTSHVTRIKLSEDPTRFTIDDLAELEGKALEATSILAQAPVKAIGFGCTSGSFVNGVQYDKALIQKMEAIAQVKCTTTSNAVVEAFHRLDAQKIAIAAPYTKEVTDQAIHYFNEAGFDVVNLVGLGMMNDYDISALDLKTIYDMAVQADHPDAEAVFISCTGIQALQVIPLLEKDLQKPVLTSNQATFWHLLRLSGIHENTNQYGKIFDF
ncbi:maleate cis-trans isomerase family protein [Pseudogracilibacillus sp. ICA-222130]|uniref:maleate cis-trans isomerase family protein n=1 Tax=Pseudogracilibacillus sp. ICA-222130 TaxID=3134655 RepID=UPI0030C0CE40